MKTWMKLKEGTKEAGIIQTFDMEKFFDKESLLDTMYKLDYGTSWTRIPELE